MLTRRNILLFLITTGVLDSLYIAITKYGCEGCKSVHNTAWGHPFGVPVAFIGLLGYLAILAAVTIRRHKAAYIMACCGVVISGILVYAQALVLHQFCSFCLISAALMLAIWLVLFWMTSGWEHRNELFAASIAGLLIFTGWHWSTFEPITVQIDKASITQAPVGPTINAEQSKPPAPIVKQQIVKNHSTPQKPSILQNVKVNEPGYVKALVYSDQIPKPIIPKPHLLRTYYDPAGNPVYIDVYKQDILFFSSGCEECESELAKVAELPPELRPLLVDTFIPPEIDQATEKAMVEAKLSSHNLDSTKVLYDYDHTNPVSGVPTRIINGIEY
ncbi:MAG: vitamin K epoxide reductase family protein [Candidatus Saccharibacteria bacterium]